MEISRRLALAATAAAVITVLCFTTGADAVPFQFIRSSCKVTEYPALCERSLYDYKPALQRRSPRQLAHAALNVTAQRAVRVSDFVRRVSEAGKSSAARGSHYGGGVRDCVETIGECVDRLRLSVREMERMGRYGSRSFRWHLSNVQTWVSAAITDQTTCIDSLKEDKSAAAGPAIRRQIVGVNHLTSNALALINRLNPIN